MQNSSFPASTFCLEGSYPFGMVMPGRSYTSSGGEYRFGFNGMEKDGEAWSGDAGNQLDFGARIYDSRLGRWLSPDMYEHEYSSWSPYNFAADNPILFIDPDGHRLFLAKENQELSSHWLQLTLPSDLTGFIDVDKITGEVTLNMANLKDVHLNDPAVQLLIEAVKAPEIYLIETTNFAKGIDRITGAEVSLEVYNYETNYGGNADINFSNTSRGEQDKEDYMNGTGHYADLKEKLDGMTDEQKESAYAAFDALPGATVIINNEEVKVDGQVSIPLNGAGLVNPETNQPVFAPAVLLHSLAEVFERTSGDGRGFHVSHDRASVRMNPISDEKSFRGGIEDGKIGKTSK